MFLKPSQEFTRKLDNKYWSSVGPRLILYLSLQNLDIYDPTYYIFTQLKLVGTN